MNFRSILFNHRGERTRQSASAAPAFFADLNLDQIVDSVTAPKDEYDLKPFFYRPLHDIDSILYRHEVFKDLENQSLCDHFNAFAQELSSMRERLEHAEKRHHPYQKKRWFLDAVAIYCDSLRRLDRNLSNDSPNARGLRAFRQYLADYIRGEAFAHLGEQTRQLLADLSAIDYEILIKGQSVQVSRYHREPDYSAEVSATFEKFRQGEVEDYRNRLHDSPDMNTVEARILDQVVKLYPQVFARLDDFCDSHRDYHDDTIATFDREVQFYLAYRRHIGRIERAGLQFCYPKICARDKTVADYEGFDLALADKLVDGDATVISNDFRLQGRERIIVVSGPNQGGKTTFARTFGQLHYLASLGCPVPGRDASLLLYDQLLTHFEREENIHNLRGKLEDDLVRIHHILQRATPQSVVIMNEIFSSTATQDARFLGEKVLRRLIDLGALCVCVTFIDELARLDECVVSMASTVEPDDPTVRTYKVVRKPADGLAYALSLADKHRLTYEALRARL